MGGVFKSEGAFKLTGTYLEFRIPAPFCIEVYELYGRLSRTCGIGSLNLGAPVEVANLSIQNETGQTEVEGVAVRTLFVFTLILQHAVSTELDVLDPLREFDKRFLLLLGVLYFLLFGRCVGAEF